VLTLIHDDRCFYVAEGEGASELNLGYKELAGETVGSGSSEIFLYLAQEGNITFKQLSPQHQK